MSRAPGSSYSDRSIGESGCDLYWQWLDQGGSWVGRLGLGRSGTTCPRVYASAGGWLGHRIEKVRGREAFNVYPVGAWAVGCRRGVARAGTNRGVAEAGR